MISRHFFSLFFFREKKILFLCLSLLCACQITRAFVNKKIKQDLQQQHSLKKKDNHTEWRGKIRRGQSSFFFARFKINQFFLVSRFCVVRSLIMNTSTDPQEIAKWFHELLLGTYLDEKLDWLVLDNKPVQAASPKIGKFVFLEKIYLRNNQLVTLQPEIGQLFRLRKIHLNHNCLTELPPSFGQLSQLEKLDLSHNQFCEFPPVICQFSKLKELNLSYNRILDIARDICQLSKLEELSLSNNHIVTIPPEIGQLRALNILDVCDNHLTFLPTEIVKLSRLKCLRFSNNQVTHLPSGLTVTWFTWTSGNYLIGERHQKRRFLSPFQPPQEAVAPPDFSIRHGKKLIKKVHAASLAKRWSYFDALLQADVHEARTKTLDLAPILSYPAARAIVRLLVGKFIRLSRLKSQDWADVNQEFLRLPLELHVLQKIALVRSVPIKRRGKR